MGTNLVELFDVEDRERMIEGIHEVRTQRAHSYERTRQEEVATAQAAFLSVVHPLAIGYHRRRDANHSDCTHAPLSQLLITTAPFLSGESPFSHAPAIPSIHSDGIREESGAEHKHLTSPASHPRDIQ